MRRPGDRLRAFASRWCRPDVMARVIDPMIADLQLEHAEALRRHRVWKSRLVHARACIAFVKVAAVCTWTGAIPWRHGWTADDRAALIRALAFSIVAIVAVVALLELPYVSQDVVLPSGKFMRLIYLVPQALPIAMTIGATLGIVFGLGGQTFSRRVGASVVALALAARVISFVNLAWVTPAANQAFRLLISGGTAVPGIPELPIGELSREMNKFPVTPGLRYLINVAFHFHLRLALSVSPLVFACFALSISSRASSRRWMLGITACAAFFAYYMLLYGGRALVVHRTVPAYAAAWFPNAAMVLMTFAVAMVDASPRTKHQAQRPTA